MGVTSDKQQVTATVEPIVVTRHTSLVTVSGVAGFTFFLLKGLLWLVAPVLYALMR